MTGKQLKNSILQWAIQGKLVPQDPNDEPASILIEKIRAEKARLVKEKKIKKDKNESIIYRGDDNSYYEKIVATGEVKCIDDEIPFEIPQGWEWCRICHISSSYIGLTYKPANISEQGIIVLRSSNIQQGKLSLNDIVRVNSDIPEKLYVQNNDILICARNGSKRLVGKSAIIKGIKEPMTFGAFMAICKTSLYEYVYLFLQSDLFFSQLREVSGTTTINQLTQNNFNSFLIPIPPKAEQMRITSKCAKLAPYIERYSYSQDNLNILNKSICDLLKKSILQEAIQGRLVPQRAEEGTTEELLAEIHKEKERLVKEGKLKRSALSDSVIFRGDDNKYYEQKGNNVVCIDNEIEFSIPDSWCYVRLGTIISVNGGKRIPAGKKLVTYDTGHKYIRVADMKEGSIALPDIHYITDEIYEVIKNYTISKEDLYITVAGTIGKVGIVPDILDGSNLTENADKLGIYVINKLYLLHALSSQYVQNQIKQATTKVGQPKLAIARIQSLIIPIAPKKEQERIVNAITKLNSQLTL